MKAPSVFNDILGPVMRGPSSSHTAGSYHIAVLAKALLGGSPVRARFALRSRGIVCAGLRAAGSRSGVCCRPARLDVDRRPVLRRAPGGGRGGHRHRVPRGADCRRQSPEHRRDSLEAGSARVTLRGKSVGGGAMEIVRVDEWAVRLTGETWCRWSSASRLSSSGWPAWCARTRAWRAPRRWCTARRRPWFWRARGAAREDIMARILGIGGVVAVREAPQRPSPSADARSSLPPRRC